MVYETMQFVAGGVLVFLVVVAVIWATSDGNGSDVSPEPQDNTIRSDTPYHPEYATQRAAEIVNQRESGRWRGDDLHVYVSSDNADWHSQQRHIDWMTENGRAARNGVQVHKVSAAERDRISALRGSGSQVWHNTAETETPGVTETHSPANGMAFAMAVIIVAVLGGGGIWCGILLLTR